MQVFNNRGITYFPGKVRCPLAGVGTRGDFDSNRLVVEDANTEVTIDRGARRIVVKNDARYPEKTVVADFMFLAEGITASGERLPFSVHLKVLKAGTAWSTDLHRHLRRQDAMVAAELERFEVVVTDGKKQEVIFDDARADRLIERPSLALRAVKSLMAMRDNLHGVAQDPAASGFRVADLSVGFGALGLSWMLARARLASLSGGNAKMIERGSIAEMLREGAWELTLTAFSEKWLPEVVQRDLFLFGLDQLPLLGEVRERGLRKGQTLSFRFERGSGEAGLDGRSEPLPGALDVARAYLEFHMLGGLLADQAERAHTHARASRAPR